MWIINEYNSWPLYTDMDLQVTTLNSYYVGHIYLAHQAKQISTKCLLHLMLLML